MSKSWSVVQNRVLNLPKTPRSVSVAVVLAQRVLVRRIINKSVRTRPLQASQAARFWSSKSLFNFEKVRISRMRDRRFLQTTLVVLTRLFCVSSGTPCLFGSSSTDYRHIRQDLRPLRVFPASIPTFGDRQSLQKTFLVFGLFHYTMSYKSSDLELVLQPFTTDRVQVVYRLAKEVLSQNFTPCQPVLR